MRKTFKKEIGITLISLIITIIVLLILAGASISLLTGYDSIPDNAKTAVDASKQDAEDEQEMINKIGGLFDKYLSITGVYANLYKISDTEYHLIFNTDGDIAEGYTEAQLVERGSDIRYGSDGHNVDGKYISIQAWGAYSSNITKVKIEEEIKPASTKAYFYKLGKITEIEGIENIDTSNVTDMSKMFDGCGGLTSINVRGFDTSNVKDMNYMFNGCKSLTNLELSGFDTSKVTKMVAMIANCSGLISLDISGWNTSNVTTMESMFQGTNKLSTIDVSSWNTSNVNNMYHVFYGCSNLSNIDVSDWDTSNVTTMKEMFFGCKNLVSLETSDWKTANVTDMYQMFYGCNNLSNIDVSDWDTSNVINMIDMFCDNWNLSNIDVRNWNTGKVEKMYGLFARCYKLTTLDLEKWNTSNVTTMTSMFLGNNNLTTIYVGENWSIDAVTTSTSMFYGCTKLKGAIEYNSSKTDATYANWETGYLTYKNPFITTWKVEAGDTITLPIYEMQATDEERGEKETYFNYNFTVDYGDGTVTQITSFDDADRIHTYAEARRI